MLLEAQLPQFAKFYTNDHELAVVIIPGHNTTNEAKLELRKLSIQLLLCERAKPLTIVINSSWL